MQIHELHIGKQKYPRPRVGRGGKRGTTSGRGTKGQRSRAGHRIRPAERDYIQRLPKLRGYGNQPRRPYVAINLDELDGRFTESIVDRHSLAKQGIIGRSGRRMTVKILGRGHVRRPLTVRGITVSKEARKKIEAAGGKVE